MIENRELISFDGICPYNCKHCFVLNMNDVLERSTEDIVNSISDKEFDVVYISHYKENFVDPDKGLELCEKIFDRYKCHVFIITRAVFDDHHIHRLNSLKKIMKKSNKEIFVAISIPALESSYIFESHNLVPTPEQRIECLKKLNSQNIPTLLAIRPLLSNKFIKYDEIERLIKKSYVYVDSILASGLVVNNEISKKMGIDFTNEEFKNADESGYLVGAISDDTYKYINVEKEIEEIAMLCEELGVPFFEHSMPALNYLHNITSKVRV